MTSLYERLRLLAECDLREYARDSLIGIHPDQNELRDWADLMDAAADEISRLRQGVQDMLDGNYPHTRTYRPGKCPHGVWYFDECPSCDEAHLKAVLAVPDPAYPDRSGAVQTPADPSQSAER